MASFGLLGALGGLGQGVSEVADSAMSTRDAAEAARQAARAKIQEADAMAQRDAQAMLGARRFADQQLGGEVDPASPEYNRVVADTLAESGIASGETLKRAEKRLADSQRWASEDAKLASQIERDQLMHEQRMAQFDASERSADERQKATLRGQEQADRKTQASFIDNDIKAARKQLENIGKEMGELDGAMMSKAAREERRAELAAREQEVEAQVKSLEARRDALIGGGSGPRARGNAPKRGSFVDQLPTTGVVVGQRARDTDTGEILVYAGGGKWRPQKGS